MTNIPRTIFRKKILIKSAVAVIMALIISGCKISYGQRLSRDLCVDISTNHIGYSPKASKFCHTRGNKEQNYQVINTETQQVVFNGTMKPEPGDLEIT